MKKAALFFPAFFLASVLAHAQPKLDCGAETDPVGCFTGAAAQGYQFCRSIAENEVMQVGLDRNYDPSREIQRCVTEKMTEVVPFYRQAISSVKSDPVAALLQEFYAHWQISITDLFPHSGEAIDALKYRLQQRASAIDDRRGRIDLERKAQSR